MFLLSCFYIKDVWVAVGAVKRGGKTISQLLKKSQTYMQCTDLKSFMQKGLFHIQAGRNTTCNADMFYSCVVEHKSVLCAMAYGNSESSLQPFSHQARALWAHKLVKSVVLVPRLNSSENPLLLEVQSCPIA